MPGSASLSPGVPPRTGAHRWAVLAVAGTVALGVLVEGMFAGTDTRLPADADRAWTLLPILHARLTGLDALPDAIARAVAEPAGWWQLLTAAVLRSTGRVLPAWRGITLVAWGTLLGAVAWTAWRRGGARASVGGVALLLAVPGLSLAVRTDRSQVIEAVLLAGLVAAWTRSRALERPLATVALGLLGVLTLLHREAGLLWVGALAPFVAAGALRQPTRRWGRALALLVAWGYAARPAVRRLLEWPALGHPRADLPAWDLLVAIVGTVGAPLLFLAVGAALAAAREPRRQDGVGWALAIWAVAPLLLHGLWRVGLDTFVAGVVGLALTVPGVLGRIRPALALLPALAAAWYLVPQALSPRQVQPLGLFAPPEATVDSVASWYRPVEHWGGAPIAALLDATCTSEEWRSCRVVVEQGLFRPASSEFGLFELFLLAEDRVDLRTVYDRPGARWRGARVDALALYRCPGLDDRWRLRAPDSTQIAMEVVDAGDLAEAWSSRVDGACTFHWLTPGGQLARPEALSGIFAAEGVEAWSPQGAWRDLRDFRQRNPTLANRHGRLPVRTGRADPFAEGPPAGWSASDVARERVAAHAALRPLRAVTERPARPTFPR